MPRDSSPALAPPKRPSCRLCRLRKVKCVKEDGAERCNSCLALERECENPETRRRPGPVSRCVYVVCRAHDRYSREARVETEAQTPLHLLPLLPSPTDSRSERPDTGGSSTVSYSPPQRRSSRRASPPPRSTWDAHLSLSSGPWPPEGVRRAHGSAGSLAQTMTSEPAQTVSWVPPRAHPARLLLTLPHLQTGDAHRGRAPLVHRHAYSTRVPRVPLVRRPRTR